MNPQQWNKLHWTKNHSSFYYNDGSKKQKVNDLSHMVSKENQCRSVRSYIQSPLCGVSGMKVKDPYCDGYLTDSQLCMITGLPLDLFTAHLNKLKIPEDILTKYKEFQTSLWKINYFYIHKGCLKTRKTFPFLMINFKGENITIEDPSTCEDNIKKVIASYFYKRKKRSLKKSKSTLDIRNHVMLQFQNIQAEIQKIYELLSASISDMYLYMTISSVVSLHVLMFLSKVVSLDELNKLREMVDDQIYYTSENLPNSEILSMIDSEDEDYPIFVRSFLNINKSLEYILSGEVHKQHVFYMLKRDIVNISNYLWNKWSSQTSVKEAIVDGSGVTTDKLNLGPRVDEYSKQYEDSLYYQTLLEEMGNYCSEGVDIEPTEPSDPMEDDEPVGHIEPSLGEESKKVISDDFNKMKFMVGDQFITF